MFVFLFNNLIYFNFNFVLLGLQYRSGTGKSYVYVPKKNPNFLINMLNENKKNETFQPVINKVSMNLIQDRSSTGNFIIIFMIIYIFY
jgi:hypothetical protein